MKNKEKITLSIRIDQELYNKINKIRLKSPYQPSINRVIEGLLKQKTEEMEGAKK